MSMAEAWLGGIGKYPPHPEGLGNTLLLPRLKPREVGGYCLTLQDSEGIFQYLLAMLQPLSPCKCLRVTVEFETFFPLNIGKFMY